MMLGGNRNPATWIATNVFSLMTSHVTEFLCHVARAHSPTTGCFLLGEIFCTEQNFLLSCVVIKGKHISLC